MFHDSLLLPDDGRKHGVTTVDGSPDAVLRVSQVLKDGETVRAAASRGQVPGKVGGCRRAVLAAKSGAWLLARLAEKPDLKMRALTVELAARSVRVAHDTVWRFVKRAGQTGKKRP